MNKKIIYLVIIGLILTIITGLLNSVLSLENQTIKYLLISFFVITSAISFIFYLFRDFSILENEVNQLDRSNNKLHNIKKRYLTLINAIDDLILIIDNEGFIIFVNSQSKRILGKNPELLLGHHIKTIISNDEIENENQINEMLHNNNSCDSDIPTKDEIKIYHEDGSTIWVSSHCNPLFGDDGNNIVGQIVTFREIIDAKEKEKYLIYAKEVAEEANHAKSRFLANMSHELRTPLSSILGYSQFLQMQQLGPLNEKQEKYLDYIQKSGDHLLEMVNDILDLSKIEAGKIKVEKKPFNINLMLSRSPSTIKAIADKKKVDMILNINQNLGFVDADEVRIKQVIYNLLSNAIKFTEPGKKVGIDANARDDTVEIIVWDEGCGIPEEDLELIFEPFEQSHNVEYQKVKGTGLGLSIARKLIALHNGTLSVNSIVGKGSRFTILVPGRISHEEKEQKNKEKLVSVDTESLKKNQTIMIVDDNEMIIELVRTILKKSGFNAISFNRGEDAIEHIKQGYLCDLVIMDIALSGMNGIKTMEVMRKLMDQNIPFIALTGFAMKGDREKFLNLGFDDYVSKPFKLEPFIEAVRTKVTI